MILKILNNKLKNNKLKKKQKKQKRKKKCKNFIPYKEKYNRILCKQLIKFLFYNQFYLKLKPIIEKEYKLVKTL